MSDLSTQAAVRSTLLHYAQLTAQMQREKARENGELFVDEQCRQCGLFHASAACHPYMQRVLAMRP